MNSNKKFHDHSDSSDINLKHFESASMLLASKIQYQIKQYTMRKLVASDEISDLIRSLNHHDTDYDLHRNWHERIQILRTEIAFCEEQITAYKNNNEKLKIIPDRIL